MGPSLGRALKKVIFQLLAFLLLRLLLTTRRLRYLTFDQNFVRYGFLGGCIEPLSVIFFLLFFNTPSVVVGRGVYLLINSDPLLLHIDRIQINSNSQRSWMKKDEPLLFANVPTPPFL